MKKKNLKTSFNTITLLAAAIISANSNAEDLTFNSSSPPNQGNNYYPNPYSNNNVTAIDIERPSSNIYGGYYDSSNIKNATLTRNTINIANSTLYTIAGAYGGNVFSGIPGAEIYADYNTTNITGSTLYGGAFGAATGTGISASYNSVNIKNSTINSAVIPGWSMGGKASHNTLNVINSTTGDISIGWGRYTDYNTAYIEDSTVKSVYGGQVNASYTSTTDSTAKQNKVTLSGNTEVINGVYGGVITTGGFGVPQSIANLELIDGNTLTIIPSTIPIRVGGDILNFTDLVFDYSNYIVGDPGLGAQAYPAALNVIGTANLQPGQLISNISVTGLNNDAGRVLLITSQNPINFDGMLNNATDIPGLGGYDFLTITPSLDADKKIYLLTMA